MNEQKVVPEVSEDALIACIQKQELIQLRQEQKRLFGLLAESAAASPYEGLRRISEIAAASDKNYPRKLRAGTYVSDKEKIFIKLINQEQRKLGKEIRTTEVALVGKLLPKQIHGDLEALGYLLVHRRHAKGTELYSLPLLNALNNRQRNLQENRED